MKKRFENSEETIPWFLEKFLQQLQRLNQKACAGNLKNYQF